MKIILAGCMLSLGVLLGGCGAVGNAIDCHGICTRYQSCYDSKYDEGACETRCRDNANRDSGYQSKVDTCNSCLDQNKSCASTTFSCAVACAGIVP